MKGNPIQKNWLRKITINTVAAVESRPNARYILLTFNLYFGFWVLSIAEFCAANVRKDFRREKKKIAALTENYKVAVAISSVSDSQSGSE